MSSNVTELLSRNSTETIGISQINPSINKSHLSHISFNSIETNIVPNINKSSKSLDDSLQIGGDSINTEIVSNHKEVSFPKESKNTYLDIFNSNYEQNVVKEEKDNIEKDKSISKYSSLFKKSVHKSSDKKNYSELFKPIKTSNESFSLDSKTVSKIDSMNDGISVSLSQKGGIINDLATLGLPLGLAFGAHILNEQKGGFNIYPLGTEIGLSAVPLGLIGLNNLLEKEAE